MIGIDQLADLVRKYNDGVEGDIDMAPSAEATIDLISIKLRENGYQV